MGKLNQTTSGIHRLTESMVDGSSEVGPDEGYARGTIGQYQSVLKLYYRFHEGHEVDPRDIKISSPANTSISAGDLFPVEEVHEMRSVIDAPRERCLFELLAYTGQRIRAIQTLRIKDIDIGAGELRLNEQEAGLKGASGIRPLVGSEPFIEAWLDVHPTYFEPDSFLITALPTHGAGGSPGAMLTQESMRYHLRKIAERAGIEKRVHPHIFRHYFTNTAKTKYGRDDAYIKHLRGDSPGSDVMETTYQHLSDRDAVKNANASHDGKEPILESPLSPEEECPNCGVGLPSKAKACYSCGVLFTPDAIAIQSSLEKRLNESEHKLPENR